MRTLSLYFLKNALFVHRCLVKEDRKKYVKWPGFCKNQKTGTDSEKVLKKKRNGIVPFMILRFAVVKLTSLIN